MLPLTPISTGNPAWTAGQFNDHEVEFENMVTSTNQTLSASNTNQLAKAAFIYGTGATTFQENGPTANNCNLTAFTGINGLNVPDAYSEMHGAEFSFNHSIASTGPVTVNVGQSPSQYLGTKNLYLIGGGGGGGGGAPVEASGTLNYPIPRGTVINAQCDTSSNNYGNNNNGYPSGSSIIVNGSGSVSSPSGQAGYGGGNNTSSGAGGYSGGGGYNGDITNGSVGRASSGTPGSYNFQGQGGAPASSAHVSGGYGGEGGTTGSGASGSAGGVGWIQYTISYLV